MNPFLVSIIVLLVTIIGLTIGVFYLQARLRQAERDKKVLGILFNLSRALASNFSREAVLQSLAQSLSAVISIGRIGVILFEGERAVLYGVYDDRGHLPALPYTLDLPRYPELQEVLQSSRILYIREVARDPLFKGANEQIGFAGVTSLLVVPLNHGGRAMGALTLASHGDIREFSPPERELCESVAASAAIALVNRDLFDQLKNQARQLEETNKELLTSYRTITVTSEELQKSYHDLKAAQQKLVEQEKFKVLVELAYAAAHELNQPLASLSLTLEVLRDQCPAEPELKAKLETALDQTYRMAETVRKLGQLNSYQTTEYLHGQKMIDLEKSSGGEK